MKSNIVYAPTVEHVLRMIQMFNEQIAIFSNEHTVEQQKFWINQQTNYINKSLEWLKENTTEVNSEKVAG